MHALIEPIQKENSYNYKNLAIQWSNSNSTVSFVDRAKRTEKIISTILLFLLWSLKASFASTFPDSTQPTMQLIPRSLSRSSLAECQNCMTAFAILWDKIFVSNCLFSFSNLERQVKAVWWPNCAAAAIFQRRSYKCIFFWEKKNISRIITYINLTI